MPVTRSRQGREETPAASTEEESSTEHTTSTEETTATEETEVTAPRVTVGADKAPAKEDPGLALARSHKTAVSKKRKVAAAKTKLAELVAAEAQAAAAKAARELAEECLRRAEESSDESEGDEEEEREQARLSSGRVSEWLARRPIPEPPQPPQALMEAPSAPKEDLCAQDAQVTDRPGAGDAPAAAQGPVVDLEALTAALSRIATRRDPPKYMQELPIFNGQVSGWLAFIAAYKGTEESFSKLENVARIRRCLKGAALEAVNSLLISQPDPKAVLEALERRFGRPEALVMAEMEKLKSIPKVNDNARDLCIFAGKVANIVATVEALEREAYLHSPEMVRNVLEKLSPILRNKWYDYAAVKTESTPELKKVSLFLNLEADKCGAYALPEVAEDKPQGYKPSKRREPERSYAAVENPVERRCPHCDKPHRLVECSEFLQADVPRRWSLARKYHICYKCLADKHRRDSCGAKRCSRERCNKSHHSLLHGKSPERNPHRKAEISACASAPEGPERGIRHRRAYLKIAPIELVSKNAVVNTFALLDDGSTCTFIEESIAELLGVEGPRDTLWIRDANGGETKHENSRTVSLTIRGRNQTKEHVLRDAQTIKRLDFITQAVPARELRGYPHLRPIIDDITYEHAQPKVVIGQNNWDLLVNSEIKQGRADQPVASLTRLGWVLHGCGYSDGDATSDFCGYVSAARPTDNIDEAMKNFFRLESLGIQARNPKSDPEDRAVRMLDEKSRRLPDGRFETGLLWRDDTVNLHNNHRDALKRLISLERKLDRNEDLKAKYSERVDNLLVSGYAERCEMPPTEGRTWYLPHFAVVNPAKPKIRMVHDAAAKSAGKSLNDMLLTGPDLLQSLPGVVMRFRQYPYAVTADIKEMFMQVRIQPDDRDALRFLWRGDRRGEAAPDEYRMTSVIFGASSSPCTALYIKNRNARDFAERYPEAALAIERNHYMDDYISSFLTLEEAVRINREVDFVHRQAHFELRGWASNDPRTISELAAHSGDRTIVIGGSATEKTLGLLWNVHEDHIQFKVNTLRTPTPILEGETPTKREALSIIMSLFDPLGLISPVTTPAKRLMQDTWRHGISWDDPLPAELQVRWQDWITTLNNLTSLRIPRCYDYAPAATYQLHTFVDASEEAYAAAVYWRMTRADGSVCVALAAGKSRVTPLKPISIPRLELQAALLGTRLAETVLQEHDFKVESKVYWSDSRTALAWIRAEPRTFKTFVAHRLAEIEETTKQSEWRWVPTKDNVADDATRATPENFDANHRWFVGPAFLRDAELAWPQETPTQTPITTGEERCLATTTKVSHPTGHLPDISRFSKWLRLIRATARVLQFIALCREKLNRRIEKVAATRKRTLRNQERDGDWRKKTSKGRRAVTLPRAEDARVKYIGLEAHYLIEAERLWVLNSQRESFPDEIDRSSTAPRPRGGRLDALSVVKSADGTLRLRGRVSRTPEISEEASSPIILDGKHAYTRLYIQHVHEKLHHGGVELVVNELRQRAWVIKIRPTVKSTIKTCMYCRLRRAKPGAPSTGDLPLPRLAHNMRAFTYVGLDYFGPLQVTVGRHNEKRYVALFTCMTTRAIHLEIVASLTADSAVSALRRFIARRGCPREIHSDNATCFKAADRELKAAWVEAVEEDATNRQITWRYIPPAAPFMGGAWERMVRSVKEALRVTLHEKSPSDETLATLLAEVEATVNSRPLTHVAVNPDDPEALTPNHLLLGPNSRVPSPGAFSEDDEHARQHWRRAQRLADNFWRRWLREYLPTLQHRREPRTSGKPPEVGDLVIVCDENLPRNTWPRGKVTAVYPGEDGVVRVVDLITTTGHTWRRPTKKIIVLPVDRETATAGECARPTSPTGSDGLL